MHANERQQAILDSIAERGFASVQALATRLNVTTATIRRDLTQFENEGRVVRVRGGAKLAAEPVADTPRMGLTLSGTPFDKSIGHRIEQKRAIGRAAARLCRPRDGIIIDGGTTTFQMCPHLEGLDLQVLSNSLHIVSALLPQHGTRLLVPSGAVFREQNIILAPAGEESMPRFHASQLFMGAASVGARGVMQADIVLIAAERRLLERADSLVLLVDSSKFDTPSGSVVCGLDEVDTLITDDEITDAHARLVEQAGVRLIVANRTTEA